MRAGGVEREQLLDQRKGDTVLRRHIQTRQLQLDVLALAAVLEHLVLLLEVEQRPRGDRHNQLAFERDWH